jgi:hypothetical protein
MLASRQMVPGSGKGGFVKGNRRFMQDSRSVRAHAASPSYARASVSLCRDMRRFRQELIKATAGAPSRRGGPDLLMLSKRCSSRIKLAGGSSNCRGMDHLRRPGIDRPRRTAKARPWRATTRALSTPCPQGHPTPSTSRTVTQSQRCGNPRILIAKADAQLSLLREQPLPRNAEFPGCALFP